MEKVALGGSCYWCMEAIFISLLGVGRVEQGFVSSKEDTDSFSEAIVVHYHAADIPLKVLIEIHLHTHKSTHRHSRRDTYKSAVYVFSEKQRLQTNEILNTLQKNFSEKIITQVLSFESFKFSDEKFHDYYFKNPKKPFCETYINPKLHKLREQFTKYTDRDKLKHLSD
ncbi:peptide-methionine (S)-S-oxide reductase [Galbibacter sp. BG1]|uniref:peptide-methionine (S)-S-oxide reductase n=1 Tax=Galbibacter sp. BG1 TaxID=1170699 RepID=UPI0015BFBE2D|nr:peptide-methionine (S)-S-oxide reductase [Galbibacter sp. BG1]QLE01193.1 peptide-methionine (S)-S-oxide reductase [Galbibacter sp. BG1]